MAKKAKKCTCGGTAQTERLTHYNAAWGAFMSRFVVKCKKCKAKSSIEGNAEEAKRKWNKDGGKKIENRPFKRYVERDYGGGVLWN